MKNQNLLRSGIQAAGEKLGQPYNLSTDPAAVSAPALPESADVLSIHMRTLAQGYIDARKRMGFALLDAGRFLAEAKEAAQHGEWYVFLKATNTSQDAADRLMAIYEQSRHDATFANAVRTNFLTISTAYELTSAPPPVRDQLLSQTHPPTRQQIRDEKRAANPAPARDWDQPMLPEMPAPPTPADLPPEYAIVQRRLAAHGIELLSNMQGYHRAFVTRRAGMTGVATFDWADVLSKLERLEAEPPPKESDVAFRLTCPTCGETLLNGRWGDLNECGSCYHARQRAPADITDEERRIAAAAGYVWEGSDRIPGKQAVYHFKSTGGVIDGTIMTRPQFDAWLKIHTPIERDPTPAVPDHDASDRQQHLLKEARDAGRIERARSLIEHGEHAAARTALDQVEVSTRAADQLLATITQQRATGRQITLALHPDDCAALLREARMFSGSELTKRLPAIGQVLVLLVEAIKS